MMRVLTPEEVEAHNEMIESWWNNLDRETKNKLHYFTEYFMKMANCEHDWIDPNSYSNELDKTKLFCRKCPAKKPI